MSAQSVLTSLRAASLAWALCAVIPVARADSAADSTGYLKQMTLEELMDVQVTSVSRHAESLLQAPASIQVITSEDIRRSGASSIPEALRLADNLEVVQRNSHDWGISARGFNSSLANKLLVMIDGRTVYTPLFSGVFWDVQDYLLEDISRIEVVSGPGGTLWGANAVNGVINIITRSAAESQGPYAEAGGGTRLRAFAGARYGGTVSPDTSFRVYAKYFDRDDEAFPTGRPAGDGWHQEQTGFRVDSSPSVHDTLSLHGDYYTGRKGIDSGGAADTSGGNLVARWSHIVSEQSDLAVQTYYDRTHLLDPIPPLTLNDFVLAPAGVLHDDLSTYDIDFQHRFALGSRNQLVWGLGYRRTHDLVENAPGLGFLPTTLNQDLYSGFLQDEVLLSKEWSAVLGSKIEHNDYTGFEYEPNIRLQWAVAPGQSLWSAISRAARTPSRIDRDLVEPSPPQVALARGVSSYGSEYVTAYELGYKGNIAGRVTAAATLFHNDYRDLRSVHPTAITFFPLYYANDLEGRTNGLELSLSEQLLESWSLHVGYNYLRESLRVRPGGIDLNAALAETADPKHQLMLRSQLNLAAHVELDTNLRWIDTLRTDSGVVAGEVPAYWELDTRAAWKPSTGLELSLIGQNLLHTRHPEYGFPTPTRVQLQRNIFGKIAWRF